MALLLFINFTFTACDENKNLTTESVDRTSGYIIKADLTELTSKIGDRDLKLIELIKNNPVSMFKTASYQKTKTSSSEYYFDTDNIMVLKNDTNQVVYIIPAYKSANTRDNNIYSISININDDFIDTKLNILQLKDDGTQKYISRDFVYSSSTLKTSKVKDIECYCTIYITGGISQATGWDMPLDMVMYCSSCSGGVSSGGTSDDFGMGSGPNTGGTITIATVWASSGGSGYGYVYNYTGQQVYIGLTKKFPFQYFNEFQRVAITTNPEISNVLLEFLDTDGNSQSNKDFVVSVINAIEEGTVTNYDQSLVLLNAYKRATAFLAFKNQFIIDHPTTTEAQFKNWFGGTTEGSDGDYDATFWEDPNLTFQQQNLPSFINFKNACPSKDTTGDVLCNTIIGGDISIMYNSVLAQNKKLNTCAIRISRALNYSGIVIPALPNNPNGSKNTVKGADGLNYIINAKALNAWMKKTFGTDPTNYVHYTSSQGGVKGKNFPGLLTGKKGIYSMVSLQSIQNSWGTGHADLFENGECLLNCHFYDVNNDFVPVDYIDFWILN